MEIIGRYNPRTNPKTVEFDAERVKYWLSKGAVASDTVHNLLINAKIIKGDKRRTPWTPSARTRPPNRPRRKKRRPRRRNKFANNKAAGPARRFDDPRLLTTLKAA